VLTSGEAPVLVINVQRPLQNRRRAQLMELPLHISICLPLVERYDFTIDHCFIRKGL
jgi:hypothetical protein